MPLALKVPFFRAYMLVLKFATWLLNFRKPETLSGPGSSLQLCDLIASRGVKTLLIVTDAVLVKLGLIDAMKARLTERGVRVSVYDAVLPDPTIEQIEAGVTRIKELGCEAILAVGGGSSIDAAKVIATRVRNGYPIALMAGLMRVLRRPLPLYAVPTTAGTGSETTIAAVVSDPATTRKFAIMDPKLVPIAAALDGALMTGLPPMITAATGMDALTHAVEAYVSRNALARTDTDALEATRLIMQNLPKVMRDGTDVEARQAMAEASFKAGVAFTSAGVGYVHAISHNLGAYYHVPHGLANAIVLPQVLDFSKADPYCRGRLAGLAKVSGLHADGENDAASADRFVAHVRRLNADFGIPTTVAKLKAEDIPAITTAALKEAHGTYAVPKYLERGECEALVRRLLPVAPAPATVH